VAVAVLWALETFYVNAADPAFGNAVAKHHGYADFTDLHKVRAHARSLCSSGGAGGLARLDCAAQCAAGRLNCCPPPPPSPHAPRAGAQRHPSGGKAVEKHCAEVTVAAARANNSNTEAIKKEMVHDALDASGLLHGWLDVGAFMATFPKGVTAVSNQILVRARPPRQPPQAHVRVLRSHVWQRLRRRCMAHARHTSTHVWQRPCPCPCACAFERGAAVTVCVR
jgi:hypothetical protein